MKYVECETYQILNMSIYTNFQLKYFYWFHQNTSEFRLLGMRPESVLKETVPEFGLNHEVKWEALALDVVEVYLH